MCYIKYHPLDSAKLKRAWGVILESEPWEWDSVVEFGKCSSQRGPEEIFWNFLKRALTNRKSMLY